MENNPYIPGDPYSYDLKWIVDHMVQWEGIKNQAAEARDTAVTSAESALHDADRAQESMERAEAAAESAENYAEHIADPVAGLVTSWLNSHVDPDTGYVIDDSLTIEGAAADAKAVGDALALVPKITSFDGDTAAGDQTVNTICRLYQEVGITDLPSGVDITNHICWLQTVGTALNKHQVLWVPYQNGFYQRLYRSGSWSDWTGLGDSNAITIRSFDGVDTLGDQSLNSICRVYNVDDITDAPDGVDLANYPGWLWTYGVSNKHQLLFYPHLAAAYQRIYRQQGGVWSWTPWTSIGGGNGGGGGELKILVIGNSFDQDVFAYVPAILQEILPTTTIKMSVMYEGSIGYAGFVDMYTNDTEFTIWNEWVRYHWVRHSGDASLTLAEALQHESWDIILSQDNSPSVVDAAAIASSITNGRNLIRIIQDNVVSPAQVATIAFAGRPYSGYDAEQMSDKIIAATETIMGSLGFIDYVPIANAIKAARTNSTLNALGDNGQLLADANHLQNGIPDLIAAYTIVLKILQWTGNQDKGVYGSKFLPDTDTLDFINAKPAHMTHGDPEGIDDPGNIMAAQEIAALAVRNPTAEIDCSNIIV